MGKYYLLPFAIVVSLISWITIESGENDTSKDNRHKLKVLLIGSSHWDNYETGGIDVTQTNEIDIISDRYQKELELISEKIAQFQPDKIFVERPLSYQPQLDSLYNLYSTSGSTRKYDKS
ncbi:hypothetical protein [Aquimarina agarivorans]|uniref:hypothetical protein n=1 Tax=Aquimarina agarivorans TaxID=980584 RepID=UPI000248E6AD|nr:hypothetical protein [Aquimarina agarivorans]